MLPTSVFQHMHEDIIAVGQRMPVMQKLWLCCSIRHCGLELCLRICFMHCRPLLTCTMYYAKVAQYTTHNMYNLSRTYTCTDGLSQNTQRLYHLPKWTNALCELHHARLPNALLSTSAAFIALRTVYNSHVST